MKVVLAAGGSGGHIFPAIALASEIKKAGENEILFVSSKRRLDRSILRKTDYKGLHLSVNPMPLRFAPVESLVFTLKLLADAVVALFFVAFSRPDVVVGFGGYSSGAVLVAAKMLRIPVVIHEQNLIPGRANRMLCRIADRVTTSFDDSARHFSRISGKVVCSGNPLRPEILSGDRYKSAAAMGVPPERFTVLVMGGSQGSSFLNRAVSEAGRILAEENGPGIQFIHLTGRKDHKEVESFYEKHNIPGRVFSFLEKIEQAYALCDLAISRAGASAVFELAYYKKPMMLVPYPNPKNNQRSNAVYFSERGAARLREEKDISGTVLAEEIKRIAADGDRRRSMSGSAARLSNYGAGRKLAETVMELARKKES